MNTKAMYKLSYGLFVVTTQANGKDNGYKYVGEELPTDYICTIYKHPASDFEKEL